MMDELSEPSHLAYHNIFSGMGSQIAFAFVRKDWENMRKNIVAWCSRSHRYSVDVAQTLLVKIFNDCFRLSDIWNMQRDVIVPVMALARRVNNRSRSFRDVMTVLWLPWSSVATTTTTCKMSKELSWSVSDNHISDVTAIRKNKMNDSRDELSKFGIEIFLSLANISQVIFT